MLQGRRRTRDDQSDLDRQQVSSDGRRPMAGSLESLLAKAREVHDHSARAAQASDAADDSRQTMTNEISVDTLPETWSPTLS